MTTFRVRVADEHGAPLVGAAVELESSTGSFLDLVATGPDGIAELDVPAGFGFGLALVMPTSGSWMNVVGPSGQAVCPALAPIARPPWWHEIMGKREQHPSAGIGISIGVVDFDFVPAGRLAHVTRLGGSPSAQHSHGERVARFLAESPDGVWGGAAPGAGVTLSPVDDRGEPTTRRLAEAIERLVDVENPPHLVNLSLGFFREALNTTLFRGHEDLESVIEVCREAGCLPIASVGNNGALMSALPAAIEGVIGVSALGLVGFAPDQSWAGLLERAACGEGLTGTLGTGEAVFHGMLSSRGAIDVSAPGLGIVLEQENGVLFDYVGTSYSAPLVTGVLALKLASDAEYLAKRGLERTEHAEQVLRSMCARIDSPAAASDCFGLGLPRL